ncbi:BA75_00154T0 [Komagataella pastoris]|uniref:BA75_00154T0 n=1 Tax=Komagataella pastoris TaxID=4922 RepID=A0A1B2J9D1_PICPA|nr:BA75_00154T0 [Komagataella pastoris]
MKRYYKGKKIDDINSDSSEEETDSELQKEPSSTVEESSRQIPKGYDLSLQGDVDEKDQDLNTDKKTSNSTEHKNDGVLEIELNDDNELVQKTGGPFPESSNAEYSTSTAEGAITRVDDSSEEVPNASLVESSEESLNESVAESSDDSSDSSLTVQVLKPVFVRRSKNTKPSSELDPDKEKNIILNNLQHYADKARETRTIPAQKDYLRIDDTDDIDPEKEKLDWKIRELRRLKRDRDILVAKDQEYEEMQARRSLTDLA